MISLGFLGSESGQFKARPIPDSIKSFSFASYPFIVGLRSSRHRSMFVCFVSRSRVAGFSTLATWLGVSFRPLGPAPFPIYHMAGADAEDITWIGLVRQGATNCSYGMRDAHPRHADPHFLESSLGPITSASDGSTTNPLTTPSPSMRSLPF